MASVPPPCDRADFEVAVICALPLEAECVYNVLDKTWNSKQYDITPGDNNAYTLGVIGEHNVVLVHMPGMGTIRAAHAVGALKISFSNIKLALVVGVCGGMPYGTKNEEIFLGDVIVSKALLQYNFGKQYLGGFERKTDILDTLGPPSEKILALLAKLKVEQHMQVMRNHTTTFLQAIQQKSSKTKYPGINNDVLYHSSYAHQHRFPAVCNECGTGNEICKAANETECENLGCESTVNLARKRAVSPPTNTPAPMIHIGKMGSADTVMKSGHHRDALARDEEIIAVEMEGAGVWRQSPSIVIKGVCDYADSHKRKGWQWYAAAAAAACAKAFLMEWTVEREQQRIAVVNNYFLIPRLRVKDFFGRHDELREIASYFSGEAEQPRILVLHAMGGQGKSQIALKYCHDHRQSYQGVFWVNGSSTSTMTQSLVSIAQAINRPAVEALLDDDAKATLAIRTIEQTDKRSLMVFDNCDDAATFSELEQFIPQVGRVDVLFTSRHRDLAELGDVIEVSPMPQSAGIELLLHRYRGINIDDYMPEATAIVSRLGNLALAIDQASAYMQYIHLPADKLSQFLPQYLAQRQKILQHTTSNFWKYTRINDSSERQTAINAFTTWEMSFQQLLNQLEKPDSVSHFLTLAAFLGLIPISESLFRFHWEVSEVSSSWMDIFIASSPEKFNIEGDSNGAEQNAAARGIIARNKMMSDRSPVVGNIDLNDLEGIWDADRFWHLIQQAFQTSLLQSISQVTGPEGARFSFHPLIRDWLQLRLNYTDCQSYIREAMNLIVSSIQVEYTRNSDAQTKSTILLHMESVLMSDNEFFEDKHRFGQSMSTYVAAGWFIDFYLGQGRYDAGLGLVRPILRASEREQGEEHPDTLTAMLYLAQLLEGKGEYTEAEQMQRLVLEKQERVLGTEHPDTLNTLNNLGLVLGEQGKYTEAEQIQRLVLERVERVLGTEHPDTLTTLNNLGLMLGEQGKYTEAEQIQRLVLEKQERVLGKEHSKTLTTLNNLAGTLSEQGKYTEAEQIQRLVSERVERALGKEHPKTLTTLNNLGLMLGEQGRFTEAEQIHLLVLEKRERVLGKEHPVTLNSVANYAMTLSDQGKYSEAEKFQLSAFKASRIVFDLQHPQVAEFRDNLLYIWAKQGRAESEVKSMLQEIEGESDNP